MKNAWKFRFVSILAIDRWFLYFFPLNSRFFFIDITFLSLNIEDSYWNFNFSIFFFNKKLMVRFSWLISQFARLIFLQLHSHWISQHHYFHFQFMLSYSFPWHSMKPTNLLHSYFLFILHDFYTHVRLTFSTFLSNF